MHFFYLHFYRHDEAHDASAFKTRVASINQPNSYHISCDWWCERSVGIRFSIITATRSLKFTGICEICLYAVHFFSSFVFFFDFIVRNLNWQSLLVSISRRSSALARCAKCQITFSMCWKILCLNRHHWRRISGSWCDFFFAYDSMHKNSSSLFYFYLFLLFRPYTWTVGVCLFRFFICFVCFFLFVNVLFVSSILQFIKCKKGDSKWLKTERSETLCYYALIAHIIRHWFWFWLLV